GEEPGPVGVDGEVLAVVVLDRAEATRDGGPALGIGRHPEANGAARARSCRKATACSAVLVTESWGVRHSASYLPPFLCRPRAGRARRGTGRRRPCPCAGGRAGPGARSRPLEAARRSAGRTGRHSPRLFTPRPPPTRWSGSGGRRYVNGPSSSS